MMTQIGLQACNMCNISIYKVWHSNPAAWPAKQAGSALQRIL